MNANEFTILSTWDPRPETSETLGQRMLNNLTALSGIAPFFRRWRLLDMNIDIEKLIESDSRAEMEAAPSFALDKVRVSIAKVVERGVRRGDDGKPEPAGGYTINASNGEQGSRYVSLTGRGGGILDPRAGLRYAEFRTSSTETPDPAIVAYPVFKAALLSVALAWDVNHAQAFSDDMRKFWNAPFKWDLDLAWMTYLPADLAQKVSPPRDVVVERTNDGGLLLIAAEETFDVKNARHMAAARSILASLADLNAEMRARAERLWPGPWWKRGQKG
jgi:hypothetical protein